MVGTASPRREAKVARLLLQTNIKHISEVFSGLFAAQPLRRSLRFLHSWPAQADWTTKAREMLICYFLDE